MLIKENCGLIIVDVQGRLAQMVHNSDALLVNTRKLIECCQLLAIPIIWLEQNPKGLGETLPELSDLLKQSSKVFEKFHFNALYEPEIATAIKATGKQQWLVAGIEAHVCVYQTVMGLLNAGYETEVVIDCIASRMQSNIEVAIAKMQQKGASISSLEMSVFELLNSAKSDEFKGILPIIK
ncbi:isochorismatase family protein [Litorilituus lipolyticus]|uniref:Isochorismatase family protein n=1 Tax=Litorilituus lipolyticus TaxID=2491017 RepID=A0A502L4M8_9GAMM|nr:isochorismatase family protein [Litorilituus lipolyticus]TPH18124.1 isochorismatase family protein [Litorilituus lipolyticus]